MGSSTLYRPAVAQARWGLSPLRRLARHMTSGWKKIESRCCSFPAQSFPRAGEPLRITPGLESADPAVPSGCPILECMEHLVPPSCVFTEMAFTSGATLRSARWSSARLQSGRVCLMCPFTAGRTIRVDRRAVLAVRMLVMDEAGTANHGTAQVVRQLRRYNRDSQPTRAVILDSQTEGARRS